MWSTDKSFIKLEFLILKHPCWVLLSLERYPPQSRRFPISLAIDQIQVKVLGNRYYLYQ
jgi:hypothetical protein